MLYMPDCEDFKIRFFWHLLFGWGSCILHPTIADSQWLSSLLCFFYHEGFLFAYLIPIGDAEFEHSLPRGWLVLELPFWGLPVVKIYHIFGDTSTNKGKKIVR